MSAPRPLPSAGVADHAPAHMPGAPGPRNEAAGRRSPRPRWRGISQVIVTAVIQDTARTTVALSPNRRPIMSYSEQSERNIGELV